MRRTTAAIVLFCGVTFGVAACGGEDGEGGNSALVDQLVDQLDAPRDEAECVVAELGDGAEFLLELEDEGFVPTAEQTEALAAAGEACDLG
jgi:hypothetical protein